MLIELTREVGSRGSNYKVKINPLFIVLVRETQKREAGSTRVEFLTASDNRTHLHVTEDVNEVEKKLNDSPLVNFIRTNI